MRHVLVLMLLIASCGENPEAVPAPSKPKKKPAVKPAGEPDRITVQMALIDTKNRTPEKAKKLAENLHKQVVAGADFPEIIKRYSMKQVRHPGGIGITNLGVKRLGNEYPRQFWGKTIGDAVFALETGKTTLLPYKNAWFIIKRLK